MGHRRPIGEGGEGIGEGRGCKGKPKKREGKKQFIPPTVDEAKAYATEIGFDESEVENWHDHFVSNGWRVGGKGPMQDWKAALRNAKRNPIHNNGKAPDEPVPPGYIRDQYGQLLKIV